MGTAVLTSPFYKGLPFDPNLPCNFHHLMAGLCAFVSAPKPSSCSILHSIQQVLTLLSSLSQDVFTRRLVDTQRVIYLRLSSPRGPSCSVVAIMQAPLGADPCLVGMRLSVGTPRSPCEGPALPSRSLPVTLAGSEGPAGWRVLSQAAAPPLPPSPQLRPQQDPGEGTRAGYRRK